MTLVVITQSVARRWTVDCTILLLVLVTTTGAQSIVLMYVCTLHITVNQTSSPKEV